MTEPGSTQKPSGTTSEDQGLSQEEFDTNQTSSSQRGGQGSDEDITIVPTEEAKPPKQYEYQNPLLKGKTPAEIEALFTANQQAIAAQNEELNRRQPTAAPPPRREEEEALPDYDDEFLGPKLGVLEKRLAAKFEKMVAPIAQAQRQGQAKSGREQLRSEKKHFAVLEPHIDQLLRSNNVDPMTASKEDLEVLYYNALGMAQDRGINLNTAAPTPGEEPTLREEPPVSIPQNRPSSAPLPRQQGNQPRQLTEDERIIARQQFGGRTGKDGKPLDAEAEYRRLQDADEDSIVTPGFSRSSWE